MLAAAAGFANLLTAAGLGRVWRGWGRTVLTGPPVTRGKLYPPIPWLYGAGSAARPPERHLGENLSLSSTTQFVKPPNQLARSVSDCFHPSLIAMTSIPSAKIAPAYPGGLNIEQVQIVRSP